MFGETIFINTINFLLVVFFMWLSRSWGKTHLVALIYASAVAVIILLIIPSVFSFVILGFIANSVLSYVVFIIMKKFETTMLYYLIVVLGAIIMVYVAFLPVAYVQNQIIRSLL